MDINALLAFLKEGESPHVEFKVSFPDQARDMAKEMAAFSNCGGGTILIGVDDHGNLAGVSNPDDIIKRLAGVARQNCSPPLRPEIDKILVGKDLHIVWAKVFPRDANDPPCLVEGRCYIRVGSTVRAVETGQELKELIEKWGVRRSSISASSIPSMLFLPPHIKSFKGRQNELNKLTEHLLNETISIIIIEGISGIGKTTLGAKFASNVSNYNYKAFWMDCREDTSFDSIALSLSKIARNDGNDTLADILEDVNQSLEKRLIESASALAECKYALFFDDYQFVIDPNVNRFLQKLNQRGRVIKIFLISKWRPHLTTIASPISITEITLQTGLDSSACAQFLHECGLMVNKRDANKIWKLTGQGHPKALEIFVARSRTYPVAGLLSNLPVFREELKKEWLMPLMGELTEEQRNLVIDLSVFDRPIPLQALRYLYAGRDIDHLIVDILDRFILDRIREDSITMHSLIRDFCYSLISDPDKREKHKWAAEYYLEKGKSEDDSETLTDVQIEALLAAWSHLVKAEDHVQATEILAKIRAPLINRGQYEQVMFLLEHTNPTKSEDREWYTVQKARILSLWGNSDDAIVMIRPLVESPVEHIAREAILTLAIIYNDHNMVDLSIDLLKNKWNIFSGNVSPNLKIRFLLRLVEAYHLIGDLDHALEWVSRLLAACDERDNEIGGAIALRQMAAILHSQKQTDSAFTLCQTSLDILKKHGRLRDIAMTQLQITSIYEDLQEYKSALTCLQDALQVFITMGDLRNSTLCRQRLSNLQKKF